MHYTWVNLNDPDARKRRFEPLRIQVTVLTAEGRVIAEAEAPTVEAGKFQSFDFDRDQIPLPGEPGTGRLQVRLEVEVNGILRDPDRDSGKEVLASFDDQAEVINTLTGRTTVSDKPKEIVVVGSKIRRDEVDLSPADPDEGQVAIWLDLGGPMGIATRQTLRITVLLPRLDVPDGRKYKMLVAPLILDADGNVIARRGEIALEPGQVYSFDFKY